MAQIPQEFINDTMVDSRRFNLREEHGGIGFREETPVLIRAQSLIQSLFGTAVQVVPMPPVTDPTVLFLDLSKWNWPMDFSITKSRGIKAVWIKQGQGAWPDSQFDNLVQGALDAGLEVGFYHFIDPTQTTITAKYAAQLAAEMTKGVGRLSMWMDCERRGDLSPYKMLNYLIEWYETYAGITNRMIEVYTRFSWFNPYVYRSNFWVENNVGLVGARYHLGLKSPWSDNRYVPLDWNFPLLDFDKWQYSADGNGMGEYFGSTGAISMDLNLFKGMWSDFEIRYNLVAPPVDCCEELRQQVQVLTGQVRDLNNAVSDLERISHTHD